MIHNLARFFFISLLFPISMALQAAPETWTLDPQHSYLTWKIGHLGFSTQSGKWYVNGKVTLDQEKPQNSSVTATIKIANMITGLPDLDKHLKDKLFFDVTKFPTATYVSNKVEVTGKDSAKVYGDLTLHGITKPVTLLVKLNKVGKNPITDKTTAGFTATTELKRSDFGMKTLLPDLGDDVTIEIGAEASQNTK